MIADTTMAKRGSPRMGFSACFGGPLFNLLLGIGLPFTIQLLQGETSTISLGIEFIPIQLLLTSIYYSHLVCSKMTLVLSAGLVFSLSFSFIVLPIRKFYASKVYGVILVLFYLVFLVICIVIEFTAMKKGDDSCF